MESILIGALASLATTSVNVNTAQQSELQSTHGLDKAAAKRIIEYRNEHGPYASLDDLAKVIGPEATGRASDHVRFDGDPFDGPVRAPKKHKRPVPDRPSLTSD